MSQEIVSSCQGLVNVPPSITTMTLTVTLNECDHLIAHSLPQLREHNQGGYFRTIDVSKFSSKAVALVTTSSLTIKLFPKGVVHITGCKDIDDVAELIACIIDLMQRAYNAQNITCHSVAINMINVSATWTQPIRLTQFADACRDVGGYAEQPEKPPSCIVRQTGGTALVYKSGKMIVTAKTPDAVTTMFRFLCEKVIVKVLGC